MHALTSNIYILNIIMNIILRACTMHITYMHIVFIMSYVYELINILLLLLASIIIINIYVYVYILYWSMNTCG